jgi:hypothetical protein
MQTKKCKARRRFSICVPLTLFLFMTAGGAFAGEAKLDENEEVQWVMGDLSALKTAAQTYYSDNDARDVPPLASILDYFEPLSLPPNAQTLYALKGDGQGWYVGYRAAGLKSETYALMQDNAKTLGLLGDNLRTPWRHGSGYFWALALTPTARAERDADTKVIVEKNSDAADAALLIFATATLISIITDRDCYYYHVPGYDWYWRSALVYRPVHYGRFFGHYGRPFPGPPRPLPRPPYRYRTSRAGWLSPTWRNHAPGPNLRQGGDPRLSPPRAGNLRPRDPHFRNGPPQQGRSDAQRPSEGRRPPQLRQPGSTGQGRPSEEVRRPTQQRRPDAPRPSEGQRPQRQPGQGGQGRPSEEVRRPPQQRRPDAPRPSEGQRPQRQPEQGGPSRGKPSQEARRPPQQRQPNAPRDRNPSGNAPPRERVQ